jgi:putative hydrolase of the HAD superfamily
VIEAVTFDYWETLVSEGHGGSPEQTGTMHDRQIDGWTRVLEGAGTSVERERIEVAFARGWETFHEHWYANERYGAAEATHDMCDLLGLDPPPGVRASLEAVFHDAGRAAPLRLAPGIEGCLRTLRSAGVRVGIVCDVGMTPAPVLRERLDGFGILGYFDHWSFSDETGCFKPFAPAFEHALAGLGGIDPARAAHVGDGRRTDVAGALAMGMVSVRYRHFHDAPADSGPEADHVVDDHARVPVVLGLS